MKIGPSVMRIFCKLKEYPGFDTDVAYLGDYCLDDMGNHMLLDKASKKLPICMICFPNQIVRIQEDNHKIAMFTFLTYERDLDINQIIVMIKAEIPEIGEWIMETAVIDRKMFRKVSNVKSGSVFGWKRESESVLITNSFSPVMKGLDKLYLAGNWSTDFGIYGAIRSCGKVMDALSIK